MTTVTVDLGERSYDIVIGEDLLKNAANYITPQLKAKRVAIVTDENVHALHGKTLETALAGLETHMIIRPAGENQKSFDGLQAVLDALFRAGFDRNDTLIAFGGGVIGDLTGFAASVYKRGCQFIQIPTTLLSQVDSSVGGKTAINNEFGKNLIGAFYQPKLVLADTSVLKTLPLRELKAGYAEVVKYGLLGDKSFFEWLESHGQDVLNLDPVATAQAVAISCETKARIVAADEQERGERALLNLGHTFAHALEIEAGYSGDLLHGEAVSAGMEMAFEYSAAQGLCPLSDAEKVKTHFKTLELTSINDIAPLLKDAEKLLTHMDQDKKNEGGALTLILARAIGEAFVQKSAPREAVLNYLTHLSETVNA
ncbi:3-dehydroquinate synthase [Hellea balneolensis]|uniref:3-dehydroquinate synthase n=1 Tax=Hellea balneolensis TaxID=287478 RepID=UPI00041E772F|nr:3-dehydroquinate synthase [Hellea balneolensis]